MKAAIIGVVTVALLVLGGWYYVSQINATPIGKIVASPSDYADKNLAISGSVTERFSLFFVKYYNLKDATGEIFVVSDRILPSVGAKVRVKGTVKEAFSLGDQQLLVFMESSK